MPIEVVLAETWWDARQESQQESVPREAGEAIRAVGMGPRVES